MNPETIIEQCKALALQHYPELHQAGRLVYMNCYAELLETKLREVCYRVDPLRVYDSMLPAKLAAMDRGGEVTP